MKYCSKCGAEINDEAVICVKCGCAVKQESVVSEAQNVDNSVSAGLVILAILIPLFGIIYWPVKAKTRPKCAMTCGIAAIISWVVCFILMSMASGF